MASKFRCVIANLIFPETSLTLLATILQLLILFHHLSILTNFGNYQNVAKLFPHFPTFISKFAGIIAHDMLYYHMIYNFISFYSSGGELNDCWGLTTKSPPSLITTFLCAKQTTSSAWDHGSTKICFYFELFIISVKFTSILTKPKCNNVFVTDIDLI